MAMAQIWAWMKDDARYQPLLQVHDELLFEAEDSTEAITELDFAVNHYLCNTTKLRVPIKAKGSTGPDWGSLKD